MHNGKKMTQNGFVTIIDYGMGNLHSVKNALDHLGIPCRVSDSPEDIKAADRLILPGVGAFPDAMAALKRNGLDKLIIKQCRNGKPLLGICLGMQLLFDESLEFGVTRGLGLIEGRVVPIDAHGLKIPHIGWNSLSINKKSPVIANLNDGAYVYFVHSFRADTASDNVIAYTHYGEDIPAVVGSCDLPVYGAQFHPEKSHDTGLSIISAFCAL